MGAAEGTSGVMVVPLPAGLDVGATLARFARSGDDLLERWDGETLVRCARVGGAAVPFTARFHPASMEVRARTAEDLSAVTPAVTAMVEPVPVGWSELLGSDHLLSAVASAHPGLHAVRTLDPLVALVHSISAQQVNLRWAATTRARIAVAYGDPITVGVSTVHVLDLARLAAADPADLRSLQLTTAKATALVGLAAASTSGGLDLASLAGEPDDVVTTTLTALRGVGPWTAQWYLARVLGRPVVVAGDLAVRKAVGLVYGESAPTPQRTLELTAHWGPAALHAQQLVLHALGQGGLPASAPRRVPSSP